MELWVPALLGSGLMVAMVNHLLTHRRESAVRESEAVTEIRRVLSELARLVRQRGTVEIDGHDLAAAFRECEETIRTQEPALGGHWGHLVRSVRAAVGEDSGMPSWADLDWSEHARRCRKLTSGGGSTRSSTWSTSIRSSASSPSAVGASQESS
jgi:hypothetical protein